MTVIQMPKYPCAFCRRNEATQLCDFVIDYYWTSLKDEKGRFGPEQQTCDNQICKSCATNHGGYEFCPSCEKLHKRVKENHDRRGGRLIIDTLFGGR